MSKLFFIAVIFFCAPASIWAAGSNGMLWQKGNSFYDQKQYDSAAYCFELIAVQKPQNAVVYYNLGNSYYRLNQVAPAILNYERALRIAPDDIHVKDNLALAQSRISSPIVKIGTDLFIIRWWQSLTGAAHVNGLAWTAFLLFLAVVILLLANKTSKKKKPVPPQLTGFLFFFFLCFVSLAVVAANNAVSHNNAVIMQADVPMMNDQLKGRALALIPEGTVVSIREEKGEWIEIRLPDGRTGWIQQNTMDKI